MAVPLPAIPTDLPSPEPHTWSLGADLPFCPLQGIEVPEFQGLDLAGGPAVALSAQAWGARNVSGLGRRGFPEIGSFAG